MEQSASRSASTSFTPSPVMATVCPARFMAATSFFLIRRDASEDGHVLRRLRKLRVRFERPRVDKFLRVRDPGTPRDLRNSQGIVAGNDLRAHALLRKIGERLRRFGPDLVAQQDQRQRHHFRVQRFVRQLPVVKRQQQHAAALRRPFLRQRQILLLFRAVRQQNFRRAQQIRLILMEGYAAVFFSPTGTAWRQSPSAWTVR